MRVLRLALVACLAGALLGCGSDGGGRPAPGTAAASPTPPSADTNLVAPIAAIRVDEWDSLAG